MSGKHPLVLRYYKHGRNQYRIVEFIDPTVEAVTYLYRIEILERGSWVVWDSEGPQFETESGAKAWLLDLLLTHVLWLEPKQ